MADYSGGSTFVYTEFSNAVSLSSVTWNDAVGRQIANRIDENILRSLGLSAGDVVSDSAGRLAPYPRDDAGSGYVAAPRITGPVNHATPFCPDLEL